MKEIKLSLFADDMIVYTENPIDSTKKLLNVINEFGRTVQYRVNIKKSQAFLYTVSEISETEVRGKNPIYYSNKKNKAARNKPTKEVKDLYSENSQH